MTDPITALIATSDLKRAALQALRPLRSDSVERLRRYFDIELTHTSNAIEGNTLSAVETELVIDKGITIAGKPLRDHLEAVDHYEAISLARDLAARDVAVSEADVRQLHALVLRRSRPDIAGRYADQGRLVRTETGRHTFPSPVEIPALMGEFGTWLKVAEPSAATAFEAHRRLVDIHPFNDGNGRTARLLMNLLLIRAGHPPVAVRPLDRLEYVRALATAQAGEGTQGYQRLMFKRLNETLDEYLTLYQSALADEIPGD